MVRCKFVVTKISLINMSKLEDGKWITIPGREIELQPVGSGSDENRIFGDATPMGSLKMSISDKEAFNQFAMNKEYYLDIQEAKQ